MDTCYYSRTERITWRSRWLCYLEWFYIAVQVLFN